MANVYWSSDFKIKTYVPQFKDAAGVNSPQTVANNASQKLQVPSNGKILRISQANSFEVEIFKDTNGSTAEDGKFLIQGNDFELPLEDITFVEITNVSGSSSEPHFSFYVLPTNVQG